MNRLAAAGTIAGRFVSASRTGRRLLARAALGLAALAAAPSAALAAGDGALRFGVVPTGDPLESRTEWAPLLTGIGQATGRTVMPMSATSFKALEAAMRRGEVDIVLLAGEMAIEAVTRHGMAVVAQARHDDPDCCRSVLIARAHAAPSSLQEMLAMPGRWRLSRGERASLAGYVMPRLQLFIPNRVQPELFFAQETVGSNQRNALAVVNDEADVGLTGSADLQRFARRFPQEYGRLKILWQSGPLPDAQVLVRSALPADLRDRIRDFLTAFGTARSPRGDAERASLRQLHEVAGFVPADNTSLIPAAQLVYQLARQSALNGRWISEAALQARLRRIDHEYAGRVTALEPHTSATSLTARGMMMPVSDVRGR